MNDGPAAERTPDPGDEDATLSSGALARAAAPEKPGTGRTQGTRAAELDETIAALAAGFVVAGRYRVVRFVAEGGMGQVYEVEDLELRERVALKRLRPDASRTGPVAERFKREIQLARRVTHSNVCRIFDLGFHQADAEQAEEFEFLTMELLSGETLAAQIRRLSRLDTGRARPIVEQLAAGLSALHGAGIVHRDFKSRNVLLTADGGRAVITDFGLARVVSGEQLAEGASCTGALLGSPAYMAPEQVDGRKAGPAADVYALGVVMFEMVTGKLPFSGDTPLATAFKRLQGEAPSPRVHVPDLDARWEAAIRRCLRRDPAERFGSAGDVAAAIAAPPPRRLRRGVAPLAIGALAVVAIGTASRYVGPAVPRARAAWAERKLGATVLARVGAATAQAPAAAPSTDTTVVWHVPVGSSPCRGPDDALVTIVEFADFECPFSKAAERGLSEVSSAYPADVRVVWKDYPMGIHPRSVPAAMLAREALAEKGSAGFWTVRSRLFDAQPNLDDSRLLAVGRAVGLDPAEAKKSIALRELDAINADIDLAGEIHVGGIPVFYVNGRKFPGADRAVLGRAVAEEMERAQALVAAGVARKDVYETLIRGGRRVMPPERRPALDPAGHPMRGSPRDDAVLIEELGDFQDMFCRMRRPLLDAILARYGERVRLVWFDAPSPDHPDARLAATAARLAYGQQGDEGFWKMAALLLENQERPDGLKREALLDYAARLGLDTNLFKYGLTQGIAGEVDRDAAATRDLRANPDDPTSLLLDGYPLDGAEPVRSVASKIDRILAERGAHPPAAPKATPTR